MDTFIIHDVSITLVYKPLTRGHFIYAYAEVEFYKKGITV